MNIRSDWIKKDNDDELRCKARFSLISHNLDPIGNIRIDQRFFVMRSYHPEENWPSWAGRFFWAAVGDSKTLC